MGVQRTYGARRTGNFPSRLEAAVFALLKLREKSGEISQIQRQQSVVLQDGPRETRITWRADFSFIKKGELWHAEAKGFATDVWELKLKMLRKQKIKTEIWGGSFSRPILKEVIE